MEQKSITLTLIKFSCILSRLLHTNLTKHRCLIFIINYYYYELCITIVKMLSPYAWHSILRMKKVLKSILKCNPNWYFRILQCILRYINAKFTDFMRSRYGKHLLNKFIEHLYSFGSGLWFSKMIVFMLYLWSKISCISLFTHHTE